jgi:hypothetical protein
MTVLSAAFRRGVNAWQGDKQTAALPLGVPPGYLQGTGRANTSLESFMTTGSLAPRTDKRPRTSPGKSNPCDVSHLTRALEWP